jgi:multidrug efflux system membrane fusion protein
LVEPKPARRRWWIIGGIVLLIIAVFTLNQRGNQKARGPISPSVGVAKVVLGDMPRTIQALGTVTPTATVTVLPQLSGYLTQVGFTEGETVTAGQFLAQIDPRPYQVQLEQYQAQQDKDRASLGQARSDLSRYEILLRQDSIAQQQVADQRFLVAQDEAAVEMDQANIDSAKLNLAYCHITAPVAGLVGLRLVDPGNYVTPSSTTGIAVVTTMSPMTVIFAIPQNDLQAVLAAWQTGAKMTASAWSGDDTKKIADGSLYAIGNQVDTSTGTVNLRASFPNTDHALYPNEFVNIHLLVTTLHNAVLVPTPAVQQGAPGTYVYVVRPNDTVVAQPVTAGLSDGANTVITKGVQVGDVVVTDGVDRLADGMKVTIPGAASASAGDGAAGSPAEGRRHPSPAAPLAQ